MGCAVSFDRGEACQWAMRDGCRYVGRCVVRCFRQQMGVGESDEREREGGGHCVSLHSQSGADYVKTRMCMHVGFVRRGEQVCMHDGKLGKATARLEREWEGRCGWKG